MRACRQALVRCAVLLALAITSIPPHPVSAQGNPTGTISGRVTDPQGLPVPGTLVTVVSPALQGVRTATTSINGDYILPFLPAGEYEVKFELQGFNTLTQPNVAITMAATRTVDVAHARAADGNRSHHRDSPDNRDRHDDNNREQLQERHAGDAAHRPDAERRRAAGARCGGQRSERQRRDAGRALVRKPIPGQRCRHQREPPRGRRSACSSRTRLQETKVSTGAISAKYRTVRGGVVDVDHQVRWQCLQRLVPYQPQQRWVAIADAVSDRPDRRRHHARVRGDARRTGHAQQDKDLAPAVTPSRRRTGPWRSRAAAMSSARMSGATRAS